MFCKPCNVKMRVSFIHNFIQFHYCERCGRIKKVDTRLEVHDEQEKQNR